MASKIRLSSAGMRELLRSSGIRAALRGPAEAVAARARASAPVETGEYKASIRVESATTDRVVERVVADAPHALVVEAKTGNLARSL